MQRYASPNSAGAQIALRLAVGHHATTEIEPGRSLSQALRRQKEQQEGEGRA